MKRHSLLFGVEDYPGTGSLTPLSAPGADVDALLEVVSDPRYMGEVGKVRPYIEIDWQGHRIWGITAAILANLARRLAWHSA